MDKRFTRYFGNNVGRKLYITSLVLVVVGIIVGYFYWWYYGMPVAIVGVIGFLVTSGIQVSDKDIDEHVQGSVEAFKERLDGRSIGKEKLDVRDFSFFYGFIREDAKTRFVAGRDGRVRTSRYYVTALSSKDGKFKAFTAIYDLLSDEAPSEQRLISNTSCVTDVQCENVEFPAGNKKYVITVNNGEESTESITLYLPNDALADKIISELK